MRSRVWWWVVGNYRHEFGLFPTATWLHLMEKVGFVAKAITFQHSDVESGSVVFAGVKR